MSGYGMKRDREGLQVLKEPNWIEGFLLSSRKDILIK